MSGERKNIVEKNLKCGHFPSFTLEPRETFIINLKYNAPIQKHPCDRICSQVTLNFHTNWHEGDAELISKFLLLVFLENRET